MDYRDGNGIRVRLFRALLIVVVNVTTVFAKKEIVFARTSPQHKLEIGQYWQLVVAASALMLHVLLS